MRCLRRIAALPNGVGASRKRRIYRAVAVVALVTLAAAQAWCGEPQPPAAAAGDGTISNRTAAVPGEIVVGLRPGAPAAALGAMHAQFGARVARTIPQLGVLLVRLPHSGSEAATMAAYRAHPAVRYAEPHYLCHAVFTPNDPYFGTSPSSTSQWGPWKISCPPGWDLTQGSSSVVIAVCDTGIDYNHPDFVNAGGSSKIDDSDSANFVTGLTGPGTAQDDHGHGTHVSGIAAAATNNSLGVAGVGCNCRIMPVKVLNSSGSGSLVQVANGIVWAAEHGAKVINLSLGSPNSSSTLQSAVDYAWESGAVIVAAAGNYGIPQPFYPAACANAIAVGATDSSDARASFSNFGSWVSVAAPGVSILSTYGRTTYPSTYATMSGTSMASPHAAGEAGLLFAMLPGVSNGTVRAIIESNAAPVGSWVNHGRIDVYQSLSASQPILAPTPTSLNFSTPLGGPNPPSQELHIYNGGSGTLNWTATKTGSWLSIGAASGVAPSTVTVSVDASGLAAGTYYGSITVDGGAGAGNSPQTVPVRLGVSHVVPLTGWPKATGGAQNHGTPALGDLDGDGDLEVVIGSSGNGKVYAWHADGTAVTGWPQTTGTWDYVDTSPALGDLDGDGDLEVVIGVNPWSSTTGYRGKMYAWHSDGTPVAGWPQEAGGNYHHIGSPALGDLDGDGDVEVVAGSGAEVYAWHHDGTPVAGWPQSISPSATDNVSTTVTLGDIDGDGALEVVVGAEAYPYAKVHAWHGNGTPVTGWPQTLAHEVYSSPALGDLDGDGILDVVVGATEDWKVYAWHGDGTPVAGWPQSTGGWVESSPALGDLDGDGSPEVVVGCADGYVYAWHSDGTVVDGWPQETEHPITWGVESSPALGDLDGDGSPEVVIGSESGHVHAWHGDGTVFAGWPQAVGGYIGFNSPALGDLNQDGDVEAVISCQDGNVYAWTCDIPTPDRLPWPVFRHDARRTGVYEPPVQPQVDHFAVQVTPAPPEPQGGDLADPLPFVVRVEARDAGDALVSSYNGTATLAASVGTTAPGSLPFAGGVWEGEVTILADLDPDCTLTVEDLGIPASGTGAVFALRGKGDVNADGAVNVLDVMKCVNLALGNPPAAPPRAGYQLWAADINRDSSVNVLDIIQIVNKSLGGASGGATASARGASSLGAGPVAVSLVKEQGGTWAVRVSNAAGLAGVQLEIAGGQADVSAGDLIAPAGWQVNAARANGRLRVIAYSPTATGLTASEGNLLRLAAVHARPRLTNVVLSDALGRRMAVRQSASEGRASDESRLLAGTTKKPSTPSLGSSLGRFTARRMS
jgi:thermitase